MAGRGNGQVFCDAFNKAQDDSFHHPDGFHFRGLAGGRVRAALALPNYDELTVASLRARLRNLSNDDLVQLKEYEQAHQNRPEVVKMFQNRLIKMTAGMPKLES